MSRRDTIIIAALLNAGLLVILFTTALKTDTATELAATDTLPPLQKMSELTVRKEPAARQPGDEVDQVLRDFAQPQPASQIVATAPTLATPVQAQPSSSNFADEINALAFPAPETAPVVASTPPAVSFDATSAPVAAAPASQTIDVVVKKGDVLEKIARNNHTTVEQIMKQNQLSTTNLRIGQVLKVTPSSAAPKKAATVASTPPAVASSSSSNAKYYTVKNGDNPWTIAVKNHMKVDELLKLNNLDEEKARRLKPGDQLRIK